MGAAVKRHLNVIKKTHCRPLSQFTSEKAIVAAALLKRGPEGGLRRRGVGSGVDGAEGDLGVLGPARDQAPIEQRQLPLAAYESDRGHWCRWWDVEPGFPDTALL